MSYLELQSKYLKQCAKKRVKPTINIKTYVVTRNEFGAIDGMVWKKL